MSGAQTRIGVDTVVISRMLRDGAPDALMARALLSPGELRWALARPTSPVRLAASVALKEAAIKCAGGRWPGFDWRHIRFHPVRSRDPGCQCGDRAAALISGLCAGVPRSVGIRAPGVAACCSARHGAPATWGRDGGLVIAVVVTRTSAISEGRPMC